MDVKTSSRSRLGWRLLLGALALAALLLALGPPESPAGPDGAPSAVAQARARLPAHLGRLPLVDTHAHLLPAAAGELDSYIDNVARDARKCGVVKLLVGLNARPQRLRPPTQSPLHDEISLRAHRKYPDLFVPLLAGFDPTDPAAPAYVERQLRTGLFKGIGELDLRNPIRETVIAADGPVLMKIYALAARFGVPVLLHHCEGHLTTARQGMRELENAFRANPQTQFILGHREASAWWMGSPNVHFQPDAGCDPIGSGAAGRTLLGSDVQLYPCDLLPDGFESPYEEMTLPMRQSLVRLSREEARAVAWENADRLFGLGLARKDRDAER